MLLVPVTLFQGLPVCNEACGCGSSNHVNIVVISKEGEIWINKS